MPDKKKTSPQPKSIPIVALRGLVFFPGSSMSFEVGRESSAQAIQFAMAHSRHILLLAQKDPEQEDPGTGDLYRIGTIAVVRQVVEVNFGLYKVLCEGEARARVQRISTRNGFFQGRAELLPNAPEDAADALTTEALRREVVQRFGQYAMASAAVSPDTVGLISAEKDLHTLCDLIVLNLNLKLEERQKQLEEVHLVPRLESLLNLLQREINIATIAQQISGKVSTAIDKNQRDYFLREQLHYIEEELGEGEEDEAAHMKKELEASQMPAEEKQKVLHEIERYSRMPENFPETSVQRNWLELLLELPFGKMDEENHDLKRARRILERDHYGLKKVKERILEYIAVRDLQVKAGDTRVRGPILCFVGPPGVGKTSIARSIAEALGRRYVRMSLGGITDEAEIRGHRRTYIGSMPGRIIQGIRQAGVDNPLFLLDEIDKLGHDFRGDPASAVLEVLDPEQNNNFRDHYVEIPYDLSHVIFITTANNAWDIPEALLDRIEMIELGAYTAEEKLEIARQHLLPRQAAANALRPEQIQLTRAAFLHVINHYTMEAGVRELERELAHICRRVAMTVAEGKMERVKVGPKEVESYLGSPKFFYDKVEKKDQVGTVTGLAWTSVGGDTLTIEVNVLMGKGNVELTGSLGDVMKESAHAAITYIRSRAEDLGLDPDFASKVDLHIHVPAGAVPKDGPSAGITLATALASALSGRAVPHDLAMTGEITLRGRVLPIGGLKEKSVAAKRAGIKTILIPKGNERDLEEIPETVKKVISFIPVESMDEVLSRALLPAKEGLHTVAMPEEKTDGKTEEKTDGKTEEKTDGKTGKIKFMQEEEQQTPRTLA